MSKVHVVSWSELNTLRRCPFKHKLAYRERWVEPELSPALAKGTLWHAVMEAHYNTLMQLQGPARARQSSTYVAKLLNEATQPLLYGDGGKQTEVQELIEWMYRGYVEHYGTDDDWKIKAVEHGARIWLPTQNGGRSRFLFKMKMDLVVEIMVNNRPTLWVVDHKSGKNLPNQKMLELDDQFGLYTWGMRKLGRKILGSIHSAARTQRNQADFPDYSGKSSPQTPDERFRRTMMNRTDQELDTIAHEAYRDFRVGYANLDPPRHTDADSCRWMCSYLEPCLGGRKGHDPTHHLLSLGYKQDFTRHD